MQPPEKLKGRPVVGGPNSPTQGISGLKSYCLMFENIYKG